MLLYNLVVNLKTKKMTTTHYSKEITAQQECFKAIKRAVGRLEVFYSELLEKEIIQECFITIEPYNRGYEARVATTYDFRSKKIDKYYKVISGCNISVQPNGFFDDDYQLQRARIECKTFNSEKSYFTVNDIGTDEDIKAACNKFVSSIRKGIKAIR